MRAWSMGGAGLVFAALLCARGVSADGRETTERRVRGIITSVDGASLTITPLHGRPFVTGRVDAARTHVVVDGHPAKASDLEVTDRASAEIGLDDVWTTIRASTSP